MTTTRTLSLVLSFGLMFASQALAKQPNVILIVADDQGYGDLSVHGNPVLKTPNMDQLAKESVRFTDFHVAPMCSPTRGQLMTGVDAFRSGCTAVCQGRSMMRRELPTMANFFAASGYATGHFGKWHLGDSYPHRPQDRGFKETLHHRAWGITSLADYWGNTYFDPVLEHNGTDEKYEGYCTDIFFQEAMLWMAKQQKTGAPFFCYLPTNTPHKPDVCAPRYSKPYEGKQDGKSMPAQFYGMIANLDENLGKLDSFLKETGLSDNTVLIYLSDNGTQSQQAAAIFNAGMRGKKTSLYEGGHRVPLFVRWPAGNLVHGKTVDELTQVQDLLPTLVELCGLDSEAKSKFNGVSLACLAKGTDETISDRKLVIQYRTSGKPWNSAVVMWGKWRLLKGNQRKSGPPGNTVFELYHVGRDPGQKVNVADQNPEVIQAMAQHYEAWYAEASELFQRERWITVGNENANPTHLYSQDWVGGFCDNPRGLAQSDSYGYWNVIVDQAGVYEIELRRWPQESNKSLTEGWEGPQDRGLSARPIASASLKLSGHSLSAIADPKSTHVKFRVQLPAGKTQLSTTFLDEHHEPLCSAIYVSVCRLKDASEAEAELDSEARSTSHSGPPNIVLIFVDDK